MQLVRHSYHTTFAAKDFTVNQLHTYMRCPRGVWVCVIVRHQCFQARNCLHFPLSAPGATIALKHPIVVVTGCHLFCWVAAKRQEGESYLRWACQRHKRRTDTVGEGVEWQQETSKAHQGSGKACIFQLLLLLATEDIQYMWWPVKSR